MRRIVRLLLVLALVTAVAGVARPSQALQSLTWEFVVDCRDGAGSSTGPLFGLPSGVYAYTVKGACVVDAYTSVPPTTVGLPPNYSFNVGTPCTVPLGGTPIPCVTGGPTVSNVPGPFCLVVANAVNAHTCLSGTNVTTASCGLAVEILTPGGTVCLANTVAGTFTHPGGGMTARFADSFYGDNAGAFLVTVEWTHI